APSGKVPSVAVRDPVTFNSLWAILTCLVFTSQEHPVQLAQPAYATAMILTAANQPHPEQWVEA
ncbi:MAG: hypothetical protein WBH86_17080, partial [Thermogutta sp.]